MHTVHTYIRWWFDAYTHTYIHIASCIHAYGSYIHTVIVGCIHTCMHACIQSAPYMHTVHKYIRCMLDAYIHTISCIHAYGSQIHTVHAGCIHTYTRCMLDAYIHAHSACIYILVYMCTYIRCMHAYMHKAHAYSCICVQFLLVVVHTYMHTYIFMYMRTMLWLVVHTDISTIFCGSEHLHS
jgi:hypothetical protein